MEIFERLDTIRGTVIGCNEHGCRVRDDETGKVVFYYGNGYKGDRVQLSIKRIDFERERVKELETENQKSDFVASFDWNRMTAQDEKVWNEIFKTLAE